MGDFRIQYSDQLPPAQGPSVPGRMNTDTGAEGLWSTISKVGGELAAFGDHIATVQQNLKTAQEQTNIDVALATLHQQASETNDPEAAQKVYAEGLPGLEKMASTPDAKLHAQRAMGMGKLQGMKAVNDLKVRDTNAKFKSLLTQKMEAGDEAGALATFDQFASHLYTLEEAKAIRAEIPGNAKVGLMRTASMSDDIPTLDAAIEKTKNTEGMTLPQQEQAGQIRERAQAHKNTLQHQNYENAYDNIDKAMLAVDKGDFAVALDWLNASKKQTTEWGDSGKLNSHNVLTLQKAEVAIRNSIRNRDKGADQATEVATITKLYNPDVSNEEMTAYLTDPKVSDLLGNKFIPYLTKANELKPRQAKAGEKEKSTADEHGIDSMIMELDRVHEIPQLARFKQGEIDRLKDGVPAKQVRDELPERLVTYRAGRMLSGLDLAAAKDAKVEVKDAKDEYESLSTEYEKLFTDEYEPANRRSMHYATPEEGAAKATARNAIFDRLTALQAKRDAAKQKWDSLRGGKPGGKILDKDTAAKFKEQAGGDRTKAEQLAREAGYTW